MYKTASSLLFVCLLFLCTISAYAQTVTSFDGIDASQLKNPEWLVDPNGAVGTKQYMEWVTPYYQAYDKVTFAPVWPTPQPGITPFVNNGVTNCNNFNGGDVIILFDRLASRWVLAAHTPGPNYYYCVAISNTDNLASSTLKWYTYAFLLNSFLGKDSQGNVYYPDWGKIATWPDAYYVGIDLGDVDAGYIDVGVMACALDRINMLIGGTPNTPQCSTAPDPIPGANYLGHSLEPADVEGTTPPPAGTPEYFVSIENPSGTLKTSSSINLWTFAVNWTNPAETNFTQVPASISVPSFIPGCYNVSSPGNTICVPEPSTATTGQSIDSVGDRLMFRFAYRNFGEYESYLVSHTVQVGAGNRTQTGIRWYELRPLKTGDAPSFYQSNTISPDTTTYRFMPSIAQDQNGNAAVGYSVSSASMHPGISASYWNLNPTATAPTEISLYSGAGDEENVYHWGTYSSMTVDPVGGCAFWYVNQYFAQNQTGAEINFNTRISTFSLPGCGSATLSPSSLAFGVQSDGTTSPTQQILLTNSQSVALNIGSITFGGANPASFTQTNDCGTSLVAGGTCAINAAFAPLGTSSGPFSASLMVNDDAPNSPQTATLTGTGTSLSTLTLSTTAVNFGNQAYGTSSATTPITVTNTGGTTVTFSSIAITGASSNFPWSNNCPTNLIAGAGCTIYVSFAPASAGNFSATIVLTDNAYGNPQSISLSGTGVVPVTLSTNSILFGTVMTGSSKTAAPITLMNQMSVPLTGITFNTVGAGFSQKNTCGTTLAANTQCTITVTFAPTTTGTQTGTVSITDNAPNSPQTISLQGTAVLPVSVTPAAGLAFGVVTVGTSSAAKTLTVTNNQTTALTINSITFTGAHPGDYSQTNTCGSSLAAKGKCTIAVTFTPTATGSRTASINITDSATNSPQILPLYGTGH